MNLLYLVWYYPNVLTIAEGDDVGSLNYHFVPKFEHNFVPNLKLKMRPNLNPKIISKMVLLNILNA